MGGADALPIEEKRREPGVSSPSGAAALAVIDHT